MKLNTQLIFQSLTLAAHGINMFSGLVPAKYQPYIALLLALVNAGLGWYAHYYNPDGTPAQAAWVAKLLILFLLLSTATLAQTPSPATISPLFSVSTQAVAVRIGGSTQPGTDAIGAFNLTPRLQLQSDNILAPGINLQAYLGGVKYQFPWLDSLLKKSSLSTIKPYFHGALGITRNVPSTGSAIQHYSALAGAGFDYQVNGTLSIGPRVEFFNAPGFGPHPNGALVSANVTVVLAKLVGK